MEARCASVGYMKMADYCVYFVNLLGFGVILSVSELVYLVRYLTKLWDEIMLVSKRENYVES
jgi:hypothetical protein